MVVRARALENSESSLSCFRHESSTGPYDSLQHTLNANVILTTSKT